MLLKQWHKEDGRESNCRRIFEAPGMTQGTAVIMDHYWACGTKAYIRLPKNWGGICTLVNVHVAAIVIPKNDLKLDSFLKADAHLRRRRSVELVSRMKRENYFSPKSEESFYAIPYEHRLFSLTSTVFTTLLLPHIQVRVNAKRLQITRWELLQTINTTIKGFNAIKEELRAIRLMTLPNRYVLDIITVMDGGVCAKIGESCCTFVPSHDEENGTLTETIGMLTTLKNQMTNETDEVDNDSWFGNLFSWVPQWMADIFKILRALLAMVLLGFCVIKIIITQCQKTAKKAIGMKMMVDVEPGWKPRDLTDEEILDFVKASEFAPVGTKFTYPKKRRRYEGKWIYCGPNGQCQFMTWNKDEHVKTAGSLKGVIKIWTPKTHMFTPSCANHEDNEQNTEESKEVEIENEAEVIDEPIRGGSVKEVPDMICTRPSFRGT
ncbi:syncytin-B-like [Ambystoma mexicanum]|uniref:syncytin-B-like n=1 Tax=Ambystoma mexicanum TaxID=8296 RepID=UPI0037E8ED71